MYTCSPRSVIPLALLLLAGCGDSGTSGPAPGLSANEARQLVTMLVETGSLDQDVRDLRNVSWTCPLAGNREPSPGSHSRSPTGNHSGARTATKLASPPPETAPMVSTLDRRISVVRSGS